MMRVHLVNWRTDRGVLKQFRVYCQGIHASSTKASACSSSNRYLQQQPLFFSLNKQLCRRHVLVILLSYLALSCIPRSDAFKIGPSRHSSSWPSTTRSIGERSTRIRLRPQEARTTWKAVNTEDLLETEWMPIVKGLQRTLYMAPEFDENQTDFQYEYEYVYGHADDDDDDDDDGEADEASRADAGHDANDGTDDIARRAARVTLLKRRTARPTSKPTSKPTSVGERRSGNVSRSRSTPTLMDTLRNKARGKAASAERRRGGIGDNTPRATLKLASSTIHETVATMIRKRSQSTMSMIGKTMGLLGEHQTDCSSDAETWLCRADALSEVAVRIASPEDDVDIAGLRLSVFSAFPVDVQNQFRARSCQAIHNRRLRGAVCIVATIRDLVVGSAECSFDEFRGTRLGRRRLPSSILYVTEVAVNAAIRRKGIGCKLLEAVDRIAEARGVESLYLHVEVKNKAAIGLYNKAGYRFTDEDPMFLEFTTSLNLHPGAMKGREHYLLCKHMPGKNLTWLPDTMTRERLAVTTLGFEIPA